MRSKRGPTGLGFAGWVALAALWAAGWPAWGQLRDDWAPDEPAVGEPAPRSPGFTPRAVLWDNGPLINCSGCGVGGADESVLQNISLGMATFGFGHQLANGNRIADNFEIVDPGGWEVERITFFAYQIGSGTASTMTTLNLRIWWDRLGPPGQVVFGDTFTDRLSATDWTNVYRVSEGSSGQSTERPVMFETVELDPPLQLAPGRYWLDWQADGSLDNGPFAPPVTIDGVALTGNGHQSFDNGVAWGVVWDAGTRTTQDFPFVVEGRVLEPVPALPGPAAALLALLLAAAVAAVRRRREGRATPARRAGARAACARGGAVPPASGAPRRTRARGSRATAG